MEPSYLTELTTYFRILRSQPEQTRRLGALIQTHTETQQMLQSFMEYEGFKKSVFQWSEQHRQRFLSLTLNEVGDPFVLAQLLQDSCEKWLLPICGRCPRRVVELLVMGQFVKGLPKETALWVQLHQPETPNEAIQLAVNHLSSRPVSCP